MGKEAGMKRLIKIIIRLPIDIPAILILTLIDNATFKSVKLTNLPRNWFKDQFGEEEQ